MKAKLLKEIQLSGISGPNKVGEIIEVRVPDGGNKVYVRSPSTGKEIELIIGTDVELIFDNNTNPLPPDRKEDFAPKTTKVKVLKEFFTGGFTGGKVNVGDIIMVGTPVNGKVYVNNIQTMKPIELIIGTDVELVTDKGITKQKLGSYMFVGAIIILSYIAYKLIKEK